MTSRRRWRTDITAPQLELAKELDLPVMIHTPHRDKKRGTTRSMDVALEHGLDPGKVIVDHNNEETVAGGASTAASGRRSRSIRPPRWATSGWCEFLRQYGAERIIVDSACDWGVSDPLGVPKTAKLARESGIPEDHIRKVTYENALAAYGQSGQMRESDWLDPLADRSAHAVRRKLGPARRTRAAYRGTDRPAGSKLTIE